jgi:hypothetical protein
VMESNKERRLRIGERIVRINSADEREARK